jgi:uncharacterized cupredoxin-like copper-binding protein
MRPSPRRTVTFLALLALPLAACGGDDEGGTGASVTPGDGPTVTVHAKDNLQFDKEKYTTEAGEVTFVYVNDGATAHTLLIKEVDGFELKVGDEDSGSVALEPGDYVLYCDLAGHEAAGMVADLEVT